MAVIPVTRIYNDVLDRLDNMVSSGRISEAIRQKLKAPGRILEAINAAQHQFVSDGKPIGFENLINTVLPTIDTAGNNPAGDSLTTYLLPADTLQSRAYRGVLTVILDGREFSPAESVVPPSLRYQVKSVFYGPAHKSFSLDLLAGRLYAPTGVAVRLRYVKTPLQIVSVTSGNLEIEFTFYDSIMSMIMTQMAISVTSIEPEMQDQPAPNE